MDLNALLFHEQVALIAGGGIAASPHAGSHFDLVGHYGRKLAQMRCDLGVAQYRAVARNDVGSLR